MAADKSGVSEKRAGTLVVVGGEKGGGGKTTIATNLAYMSTVAGRRTVLVDADPQQSSASFVVTRREEGRFPDITFSMITAKSFENAGRAGAIRKLIGNELLALAEEYEVVIVDTGGRDSIELQAALAVCDIFLTPIEAGQYDVWTLPKIEAYLNYLPDEVPAWVILNKMPTLENWALQKKRKVEEAVASSGFKNLRVCPSYIVRRDYPQLAVESGASVFEDLSEEAKFRNDKACEEIAAIYTLAFGESRTEWQASADRFRLSNGPYFAAYEAKADEKRDRLKKLEQDELAEAQARVRAGTGSKLDAAIVASANTDISGLVAAMKERFADKISGRDTNGLVVVCGGEKGGGGKTTIATTLAFVRTMTGRRVVLVDADPQKSSSAFIAIRQEEGRFPEIKSVMINGTDLADMGRADATRKMIGKQILSLAEEYDTVIVDTGGRDSIELQAALAVCDVFLTPIEPGQYDLWTLSKIEGYLKLLSSDVPALVILNKMSTLPNFAEKKKRKIFKALSGSEFENLTICPSYLVNRDYPQLAVESGGVVWENLIDAGKTEDPKACAEFFRVYSVAFGETQEEWRDLASEFVAKNEEQFMTYDRQARERARADQKPAKRAGGR